MKKTVFSMFTAGFLAVSANAACDQIASASDLITFASKVNGGDASACAELTADIYFNGDSKTAVMSCLKDDKSGLKDGCNLNGWGGIGSESVAFEGSIDGKNHTIYGLYVNGDNYPALVRRAVKSASIKNLAIEDSYFKVTSWDGGAFIGDVVGDKSINDVKIDNCSFKGVIYSASGSTKVGGLVGGVSRYDAGNRSYYYPSLTITNCYNAGEVLGSGKNVGALVGYVDNSVSLTIENSYNIGTAIAVVGASDASAGTITFNNVSCVGTNCGVLYKEGSTTNKVTTKGSGVNVASSEADVLDKVVDGMSTDADALNAFFEKNGSGIAFEEITLSSGNKGIMALLKPTKTGSSAEFSEDVDLVIPADVTVDVDSISLDRQYKAGVMSTVMFPFNIEAKYVTNARFYEFSGVAQVDKDGNPLDVWEVGIRPLCEGAEYNPSTDCVAEDMLYANHPYLVKIIGEQASLQFASSEKRGKTKLTIVKTVGSNLNVVDGLWKLQGVYAAKKWLEGDSELGNVFGYTYKAGEETFVNGRFIKVGKNSSIKSMRAYLYYDRPASSPKPALMRSTAVMSTVDVSELPSNMKVCIRDYVVPEKKVESIPEGIDVPGSESGDSSEEQNPQEGTLGLTNAVIPSSIIKSDSWFDATGRKINKPKSQGAFIKNGQSVIVK